MATYLQTLALRLFMGAQAAPRATLAPVVEMPRVDARAEYHRLLQIYKDNYGGEHPDFSEHWQANPASGNPEL